MKHTDTHIHTAHVAIETNGKRKIESVHRVSRKHKKKEEKSKVNCYCEFDKYI